MCRLVLQQAVVDFDPVVAPGTSHFGATVVVAQKGSILAKVSATLTPH
jgi:hypothetical protein